MNTNNIYIGEEIIDIFYGLLSFNDRINFTKTNKEIFFLYKDKVRCEIFQYINHDYLLFHECLKRFNYTNAEQIRLMEESMNVMRLHSSRGYFCDLRFIFELCYYSKHYFFKNIYKKQLQDHQGEILSLMIKEIISCISFNRFESLLNIEKKMILYSLKRDFKPILWKTNDVTWRYLINDGNSKFDKI